jgi:hypothetical protein
VQDPPRELPPVPRSRGLLLLVLAAVVRTVPAAEPPPDGLAVSGSLRVRLETLDGAPRAGVPASDGWLAVRSTLLAEWRHGPLRAGGEVWDSRVLFAGSDSPLTTGDANALEPVQAYVAADLDAPLHGVRRLGVLAGRYTLNLGSRRLVAINEFRNTTNAFTGARVDAQLAGGHRVLAFTGVPQQRDPADRDGLRDADIRLDTGAGERLRGLSFTTATRLAGGALQLNLIDFRETDAPSRATRDRDLLTWNLRYLREPAPGQWDADVELASQSGSTSAGTGVAAMRRDVDAGFWHLRIGYQWAGRLKPRFGMEYDHVDGDDGGPTQERFDTLFGARRFDFAPSGLFGAVGRANLRAPALRVELFPGPRAEVMASWRANWLDERRDVFSTSGVRDATGRSGRFVGHLLDSRVRYWAIPQRLRIEVNATRLLKGGFYARAPNSPGTGDATYLTVGLQAFF